jgi:hypothetical protein
MKPLLLALALLSCGSPYDPGGPLETIHCPGNCLQWLEKGAPPAWTCESVRRVELAAIEFYTEHATGRGRQMLPYFCENMKRFHLFVSDGPTFELYDLVGRHRTVYGATGCDGGVIQIGNVPPEQSSLLHELGHVLDWCATVD